MTKIYSYRWTSINGESFDDLDQDNKKNWIKETAHLGRDDWMRGLERCKRLAKEAAAEGKEKWPPSAVEFSAYSEKPMPDRDICFVELQKYLSLPEHRRSVSDLSPFTYHTYVKNLDAYNYKQLKTEEARRMFNAAYKATMFQYETGETICTPKTMIEQKAPKPVKTPKTEKVAARTISSLKAMF